MDGSSTIDDHRAVDPRIQELMRRENLRRRHRRRSGGRNPRDSQAERSGGVYRSPKLSVLLAARMLAHACERVITKVLMDEKRKGEQQ